MEFTRLRGFQDLLGVEARALSIVEEHALALARRYNLNEIRVPALERLELYRRSSGESSDLVQKQMYTLERAAEGGGAEVMALRPEGTPSVVRAYIEAGLDRTSPYQRYFYLGPMFRYERPQKGRYRQFWQFGVEIFGRADPYSDAEMLLMLDDLRQALAIAIEFEINSLGDAKCRPAFRQALLDFGRSHLNELCEDCRARLERNPLRLLDCKIDVRLAESAPRSLDHLCSECAEHFAAVRAVLDGAGVHYRVNPRLVRGLDYYTRTTFEMVSPSVGAQSAIGGGGRYDGLIESLGGAAVAGTGFAIGVDRMALALRTERPPLDLSPDAALIALGEAAARRLTGLARELRARGLRVEFLPGDRKLKALLAMAARMGARHALIAGDNELARDAVQLRDLGAGTQSEVALDQVAAKLDAAAR